MTLLRRETAWYERARINDLPPRVTGGVAIRHYRPSRPTCPDCGYANADAEVVFAHLFTHPRNDRRRRDRRAARH